MIPAAIISSTLGIPLYSTTKNEQGETELVCLSLDSNYGGVRSNNIEEEDVNLIAVDDTAASGTSALGVYEDLGLESAVCYATSNGASYCNIKTYVELLETPHILQWNFYGSEHLNYSILDIDGVMSPNVPAEIDADEQKYLKWINEVEPITQNKPHFFEVNKIVTGRLEKYREPTENWLKKNNIKYNSLVMFPTERDNERRSNHRKAVGEFKGEIYKNDSKARFFVESEPEEAQFIAQTVKDQRHKIVVTTEGGKGFRIVTCTK